MEVQVEVLTWLCLYGMYLLLQEEILNSIPQGAVISVYRVGPMVDLCTGPHLPTTAYIKVSSG